MHIFIHLLNDFSGSPRIFNEKIGCYRQLGMDCVVITGGLDGFIRTDNVPHHIVSYQKKPNKVTWILHLLWWHIRTFILVLRLAGKSDVVHCNTMLTAPHLLAAKLKGATPVSHIMETRVSPIIHKRVMMAFIRHFADRLIYLSAYVENVLRDEIYGVPFRITYPCVDPEILCNAMRKPVKARKDQPFTIGLVCSLIWFKGYHEFIRLAALCPDYRFVLVLNGTPEAFHRAFQASDLPANLVVHFSLKDVSTALVEMDVLLSLTQRTGWVETFGLTLIEALAFGIPVIAPDIGAPTEFIDHGVNGYLVDETDMEALAAILKTMCDDSAKLAKMSEAARATAQRFTPTKFLEAVRDEMQFVAG